MEGDTTVLAENRAFNCSIKKTKPKKPKQKPTAHFRTSYNITHC